MALWLVFAARTTAWQRWPYKANATLEWQELWGLKEGPGARRGHSMVLAGTSIILFGGRGNALTRRETKNSFQVDEINGTLSLDFNTGNGSDVPTSLYFNDVWAYELNCTRYGDEPCAAETWYVRHAGGGPSPRWLHGAAYFNDHTVVVYGGYSQSCEDYCSDLWAFDLRDDSWMEIGQGPGKRMKFSVVGDGTSLLVFGGFRLWHGFADDNSEANRWDSFEILPKGGYLSDFWRFDKRLLEPLEPIPTSGELGNWTNLTQGPTGRAGHVASLASDGMWLFGGYTTYFPYLSTDGPGAGLGVLAGTGGFAPYPDSPFFLDDLWFYNFTTAAWTWFPSSPAPRTDAAMVLVDNLLILVGGFNGTHFFDDTWYFNTTSLGWLAKTTAVYPLWPLNCTDDFPMSDDCFLLQEPKPIKKFCSSPSVRGCAHFDWIEPDPNNTDIPILNGTMNPLPFYGIVDAPPTRRATGQFIVPFAATGPRQFVSGLQWWNATFLASRDIRSYFVNVETVDNTTFYSGTYYERCTSVFGEATRGTVLDGQHGRASSPIFIPQPRRRAPGWDGCRDRCFGVEWATYDGECPEITDEGLHYYRPNQRSEHSAVYSRDFEELFIYGGLGYLAEMRTNMIHEAHVLDDMWRLGIHDCANNCSGHGDCRYGYCFCHPGYYGVDCSNISCPGDFCYIENNVQICQHCCQAGYNHSDHDVYVLDVPKVPCSHQTRRNDGSFGQSNGICDGFGTCQCAPPFVLDDCSVKDCPLECSHRGSCSIEFPVSRCVCHPGYYGDACEFVHCLNNCSYPNGHCDVHSGTCTCELMYSPYNNSRPYRSWQGDDCSFLYAYCSASSVAPSLLWPLLLVFASFLRRR